MLAIWSSQDQEHYAKIKKSDHTCTGIPKQLVPPVDKEEKNKSILKQPFTAMSVLRFPQEPQKISVTNYGSNTD